MNPGRAKTRNCYFTEVRGIRVADQKHNGISRRNWMGKRQSQRGCAFGTIPSDLLQGYALRSSGGGCQHPGCYQNECTYCAEKLCRYPVREYGSLPRHQTPNTLTGMGCDLARDGRLTKAQPPVRSAELFRGRTGHTCRADANSPRSRRPCSG